MAITHFDGTICPSGRLHCKAAHYVEDSPTEAQRQNIMEAMLTLTPQQLFQVLGYMATDDNLDMIAEAIMSVRGDLV